MRTNSIRLHLGLGISLAVSQVLLLLIGAGSAATWANGLATFALLLLLIRTMTLHRDRRDRLLEILAAVQSAAEGEVNLRLPASEDDEAGRVAGAVNQLVATVRERARVAQAERELDQLMVQKTPNGLAVIDAAGLVRRASPALGHLLGFTDDPVGKRPSATIGVPSFQYVCDEAARTREISERPLTFGGRELLLRAIPAEDGSGVLGVVLDLTSMGTADRIRRDFVANVSHELRTPVTAIVGYAEALEADRARIPEDMRPHLEAVARNAERLRLLVEDVLSLSQIETRPADLVLEPTRVTSVVEGVRERFVSAAERRGITISLLGKLDAEAWINTVALEHVIGNLVDNAVKYTPEGGRVDIEVVQLDDAVEIWVRDTGPGIDPIHHSRIFERFYRVDPGRARALGGTGLGLALVKHLCASMRAEVRLLSEVGKGCRFAVRLPVSTPE